MDIKKIREINLRKAIEIAGSAAKLCDQADIAASYVSSILSPTHKASLGNKLARKIESSLNVHEGWMDIIHPDSSEIDISEESKQQDKKYLELLHLLDGEQKKEILELIDLMARKRKILDKYS